MRSFQTLSSHRINFPLSKDRMLKGKLVLLRVNISAVAQLEAGIHNSTTPKFLTLLTKTGCSHSRFTEVFDDLLCSYIACACLYLNSRHNTVTSLDQLRIRTSVLTQAARFHSTFAARGWMPNTLPCSVERVLGRLHPQANSYDAAAESFYNLC